MPERMDNIEKSIEKLTNTVEKFIEKLGKDYVPKDQCKMCHENLRLEYDQKLEAIKEDNKRNENNIRTVMKILYGAGVTAIMGLVNIIAKRLDLFEV